PPPPGSSGACDFPASVLASPVRRAAASASARAAASGSGRVLGPLLAGRSFVVSAGAGNGGSAVLDVGVPIDLAEPCRGRKGGLGAMEKPGQPATAPARSDGPP